MNRNEGAAAWKSKIGIYYIFFTNRIVYRITARSPVTTERICRIIISGTRFGNILLDNIMGEKNKIEHNNNAYIGIAVGIEIELTRVCVRIMQEYSVKLFVRRLG